MAKVVIIVNCETDQPEILKNKDGETVFFESLEEGESFVDTDYDSSWGETRVTDIE